jgi:type II secretory pathway predicted ATPase ExeA
VTTGPADPHLAHWGFAEAPFLLSPDPRFCIERDGHREGLSRILFGLSQQEGLVVVTGEIGCGKTMLTRSLEQALPPERFLVARVGNPPRTPAALLAALARAAGEDVAAGTTARLSARIRDRAAQLGDEGLRLVPVIDEAQRLNPAALEELRLLTNGDGRDGLAVVLLGQPELNDRLARLPQIEQRILVRHHLTPLAEDEVQRYVEHRARVAGAPAKVFSRRACQAIYEETGGVPRLVNLICSKALFVAADRGEDRIGEDTVRDIAEDQRLARTGEDE